MSNQGDLKNINVWSRDMRRKGRLLSNLLSRSYSILWNYTKFLNQRFIRLSAYIHQIKTKNPNFLKWIVKLTSFVEPDFLALVEGPLPIPASRDEEVTKATEDLGLLDESDCVLWGRCLFPDNWDSCFLSLSQSALFEQVWCWRCFIYNYIGHKP